MDKSSNIVDTALNKIANSQNLTEIETENLFTEIMSGNVSDIKIAAITYIKLTLKPYA